MRLAAALLWLTHHTSYTEEMFSLCNSVSSSSVFVLIIFHIVFYFNNPLSPGSCDCTIAEFIQSIFFLHRTGIFLSYCTVLKRAEQRDLISVILICLCIEETKAAINLHMLIFCLVLSFFVQQSQRFM